MGVSAVKGVLGVRGLPSNVKQVNVEYVVIIVSTMKVEENELSRRMSKLARTGVTEFVRQLLKPRTELNDVICLDGMTAPMTTYVAVSETPTKNTARYSRTI